MRVRDVGGGGEALRVLVVGKHASMRFGGEATLPLLYFRRLRARGVEAWMLTHSRTQGELRELLTGEEFARVRFLPDTAFNRIVWRFEKYLPERIGEPLFDTARYIETQWIQRRMARELVRELGINVVHESAPISAKRPSAMYGLGEAAVVVGPLCGGMSYPKAFRHMQGFAGRMAERFGRGISQVLNWVMPGKLRADVVLVANDQTRRALPRGVRGKIYQVVESGVDLDVWKPASAPERREVTDEDGVVRFVFLGRLVDWKGVNFLLEAFRLASERAGNARLQIIGDGVLRQSLEARTKELGLADRVEFTGWVSRAKGAEYLSRAQGMVLPSLRECGGTAILEAFAMGVPVICARWGGPAHYVDDATGFRVGTESVEAFVNGLAEAMVRMAGDAELRRRMSEACVRRAREQYFDWESKVTRLIEVYREAIEIRAGREGGAGSASPEVQVPQRAALDHGLA